jgi:hypothetical protein
VFVLIVAQEYKYKNKERGSEKYQMEKAHTITPTTGKKSHDVVHATGPQTCQLSFGAEVFSGNSRGKAGIET